MLPELLSLYRSVMILTSDVRGEESRMDGPGEFI